MLSSLPPRDLAELSELSSARDVVSTPPSPFSKMSPERQKRRLSLSVLELAAVTYMRLPSRRKCTPTCTVSAVA
jgi:hypothetical protein